MSQSIRFDCFIQFELFWVWQQKINIFQKKFSLLISPPFLFSLSLYSVEGDGPYCPSWLWAWSEPSHHLKCFEKTEIQSHQAMGLVTEFLAITRSIVQGSGLGPMLYIALVRKLKALSKKNALSKYADDTSLLDPQHTDCSIEQEFAHVVDWSTTNKLTINKNKTQEIIFYRSNRITTSMTFHLYQELQGLLRSGCLV